MDIFCILFVIESDKQPKQWSKRRVKGRNQKKMIGVQWICDVNIPKSVSPDNRKPIVYLFCRFRMAMTPQLSSQATWLNWSRTPLSWRESINDPCPGGWIPLASQLRVDLLLKSSVFIPKKNGAFLGGSYKSSDFPLQTIHFWGTTIVGNLQMRRWA